MRVIRPFLRDKGLKNHNIELEDNKGFNLDVPDNSERPGVYTGDEALDNSGALPLGSHLKCPVCGLLKINHDCIAEIENPKPKKREVSLHELLWGKPEVQPSNNVIPLNPKKKSKPKPLKKGFATFYAWEGSNGEYIKQRGLKSKDSKGKHLGSRDADLYSIGKFIKGGNGHNRNLENLVCVSECFSDLDPDFPLEWMEIVECARDNGLPFINRIVRSKSDYHYQIHWYIPDVYFKDKKSFELWLWIQERIFSTFKHLGADPLAVKNPIQYLRDPDKYEVVYENKGLTTLSELYEAFENNDAIEAVEANSTQKKRRRNQQSFSKVSLPRLRQFFKDNPQWEGTYKELSERLSIPERSIYHLMNVLHSEGLRTETFRAGRTWKTRFTFDTARKEYLNRGGVYAKDLDEAKKRGIAENYRNVGVFVLALWLSVHRKLSPERVLMELDPVFIAIDRRSAEFSEPFKRSEFERTVKSACRPKYKYFAGFKNKHEKLQCLIEGLH